MEAEPIKAGDLVAHPDAPTVICRVVEVRGDWGHLHVVRKNGDRNRKWRGRSGNIKGYVRVPYSAGGEP